MHVLFDGKAFFGSLILQNFFDDHSTRATAALHLACVPKLSSQCGY
ncbi:unnamed protein product [Rhodiola kirilowii]